MRECQNDLAAGSADRYHPGHIFRGTQCEEQKMRMRQSITIVSMVFFAAIASTLDEVGACFADVFSAGWFGKLG